VPSNERKIDGRVAPDVLARISGRELLISHLGYWPTFDDFEVLSILLERAPVKDTITSDLKTTFRAFDINKKKSDPERRQAIVEIQFGDISELKIDGFNYQNPITGLSIKNNSNASMTINWGGTGMHHAVSFICGHIAVLRVIDLNPFRKSLDID